MKSSSYVFLGSLLILVGTALWTIFVSPSEGQSPYNDEELGL